MLSFFYICICIMQQRNDAVMGDIVLSIWGLTSAFALAV